jgi:hypothetical protein
MKCNFEQGIVLGNINVGSLAYLTHVVDRLQLITLSRGIWPIALLTPDLSQSREVKSVFSCNGNAVATCVSVRCIC